MYINRKEKNIVSRSRRKTKIFGITTAESEKQDKRKANRKFRKSVKDQLKNLPVHEEELDDLMFPDHLREVHEEYLMDKDGKKYWADAQEKDMRK